MPTPSGTQLLGRVLDEQGKPQVGVVVYLFKAAAEAEGEIVGAISVITDELGFYRFVDVEPGDYRVSPNMTGYTFAPPVVSVPNGGEAPVIAAIVEPTLDQECKKDERTKDVVLADSRARALFLHGLVAIKFGLSNSRIRSVAPRKRRSFKRSLERAKVQLERGFTRILLSSKTIPKIVVDCRGIKECRNLSFNQNIKNYTSNLNTMHSTILFALRRMREDIDQWDVNKNSEFVAKARSLLNIALSKGRKLPRSTQDCSAEISD